MKNNYLPYLQNISSRKKEMVSALLQWSNQNSHSDNVEGLNNMSTLILQRYERLGGRIKQIPLRPRQVLDNNGNIIKIAQGAVLQIVKRPRAAVSLLLGGHMDTVFPPFPHQPKAFISSSQVKGPGVADMKGGLLVMLKALEALENSPWAKKIGWEVLITPDEEIGSPGSRIFYERAAKRHRAGLLFEPTFPDGSLVSSRKGSRNLVIAAKGVAAHAGRDFASGRNAVTALARCLLDIEQLTDTSKGITVNIGHLEGGGAFNIVPHTAMAKVNIRVENAEDFTVINECIQMLVEDTGKKEGIALAVHDTSYRPPKPIDEATCRLFTWFSSCSKELGSTLKWKPSGGVCDGNILGACGLPTLDTLGVVGGQLHTSGEYAEIDSLTDKARLTALFLLRLASGEITLPTQEADE